LLHPHPTLPRPGRHGAHRRCGGGAAARAGVLPRAGPGSGLMAHGARSDEPPRLVALEARVMDVLWDHGPATIRQIITRLSTEPAYTTIATVLANLQRKNLVTITRKGRSAVHAARMSREQHAAELMEHVLDASRDRTASILHFV